VPGGVLGLPSLKTQLWAETQKIMDATVASKPFSSAPSSALVLPQPVTVCIAPPTDPAGIISSLDGTMDIDGPVHAAGSSGGAAPTTSSGGTIKPVIPKDVCLECVIRTGLTQLGKTAAEFPTASRPVDVTHAIVDACYAASATLPTRSADVESHSHVCHRAKAKLKGHVSRKTCKRDVRLELQGDEHATARAMYAKVRNNIQRHL
jgi:hypothetical protein